MSIYYENRHLAGLGERKSTGITGSFHLLILLRRLTSSFLSLAFFLSFFLIFVMLAFAYFASPPLVFRGRCRHHSSLPVPSSDHYSPQPSDFIFCFASFILVSPFLIAVSYLHPRPPLFSCSLSLSPLPVSSSFAASPIMLLFILLLPLPAFACSFVPIISAFYRLSPPSLHRIPRKFSTCLLIFQVCSGVCHLCLTCQA